MVRDDRRSVPGDPTAIPSDRLVAAWVAAGTLLLALIGLTALLPAPTDLLTVSGSGAAAVDTAVLAGAALLVWALTAWVAVVVAVALVGVLPGACGRQARRLLGLIAPRLALRLVAVAVGSSALAGTTACSAPIFASATSQVAATTAPTEPAVTASPQVLDPADTAASSALQIDIDWPSAAATSAAPTADTVPVEPPPSPSPSSASSVSVSTTAPGPSGAAAAPATATSSSTSADGTSPAAAATPSTVTHPTDGIAGAATPGATQTGAPTPAPQQIVTRPSGEPIVVRPGDTLWALAAEGLPDGSGDAAVDAAWHQWYALNREVIGDDPDLLQPGQHLVPPPTDAPTTDQENDR